MAFCFLENGPGFMNKKRRKTQRRRTGVSLKYSSEYHSWKAMRARCWYPRSPSYQYFGALGIEVCEEWAYSFSTFLKDMGTKPSPRHGISRKDAKGDFTPDNCYWATPNEQQRNSLKAIFLEFQGERHCLTEWSEKLGISVHTISTRINRFGWTPEQALGIEPVMGHTPIGDARRAATPRTPITGPSARKSSSGVFGVSWHKVTKRWQAILRGMGKPIRCGYHATKEEAIAAIEAKAKEIQKQSP